MELRQGSTLRPFLFTLLQSRSTYEVKRGAPWTTVFEDDIVICGEKKQKR